MTWLQPKEDSLASIELAQSKQIDGKFNKYNLIITAFGAKEAYLNRIINSHENTVEYKKEHIRAMRKQEAQETMCPLMTMYH